MCVVSMIMEHYTDKWQPRQPQPWEVPPDPHNPWNQQFYPTPSNLLHPQDTQKQLERFVEAMKPKPPAITPEEIAEFRVLLERAREYDRKNNEPNCELSEKRDVLTAIANALGVDISFVEEAAQ